MIAWAKGVAVRVAAPVAGWLAAQGVIPKEWQGTVENAVSLAVVLLVMHFGEEAYGRYRNRH